MANETKSSLALKKAKDLLQAFLKSQLIKAVTSLAIKYGLKVSGPIGLFLSIFSGKISKWISDMAYKLGVKVKNTLEENKETKKELEEYEKKINDHAATPKDIKDAGKDFLTK